MMSRTQKALLYANIPTLIYDYVLDKRLRDRFLMSPVNYPAITVSFLSEGIKKGWSTGGPISKVRNPITQEYDSYYGEQDVANISLTVWSMDEDELRDICDGLEMYIKLGGLDFDWARDHIKVIGIKSVQLLEPFADEFVQEHTWRAVIDFTIEYLWAIIEVAPAIRAFEYLFDEGTDLDKKSMNSLSSYMEGSYGMDLLIKGWRSTFTIDALVLCDCAKSYSMGLSITS
jgi:hypothetical protein